MSFLSNLFGGGDEDTAFSSDERDYRQYEQDMQEANDTSWNEDSQGRSGRDSDSDSNWSCNDNPSKGS